MDENYRTDIVPQTDSIKYHAVKTGFLLLGRALQSASNFEKDIKKEIAAWNEGFTFSMDVLPNGPSLDTAFQMITTQLGAHHVYAQHKISVTGNIADSMRLIRMFYIVEAYLFPKILNKNILKKSPRMTLNKHLNRMHIYTVGMLFGK